LLTIPEAPNLSPLALAWRHTGVFWSQTAATLARHPVAMLACAAVPAAGRCFVLLRGTGLNRGAMATMELLVTMWRAMLCAAAVWAACSGQELHVLAAQMGVGAAWQLALENVGAYLAHHIRALVWEVLFFVVALLLVDWIARWLARALAARIVWLRDPLHRKAALSVWRNLILLPVALIYLVEMARPALR
jgi:hypothetical protein